MIIFYLPLGVFIICGIYLLATFKKKTPLDRPFMIAVIIAAAVCLLMLVPGLVGHADTDAQYEELMLYKGIVEECNDEAVRFDYYERVQEWNSRYADWYNHNQSKWIGYMFGNNRFSENVGLIDFELRRD